MGGNRLLGVFPNHLLIIGEEEGLGVLLGHLSAGGLQRAVVDEDIIGPDLSMTERQEGPPPPPLGHIPGNALTGEGEGCEGDCTGARGASGTMSMSGASLGSTVQSIVSAPCDGRAMRHAHGGWCSCHGRRAGSGPFGANGHVRPQPGQARLPVVTNCGRVRGGGGGSASPDRGGGPS